MNAPQDLPVAKGQVLAIHDVAIARFGGLPGVRDEGLLDSAPGSALADLRWPGPLRGRRRQGLPPVLRRDPRPPLHRRQQTHGAALLGASLRLCGHHFKLRHDDFLRAMPAVTDGSMSYEQLVEWVEKAVS